MAKVVELRFIEVTPVEFAKCASCSDQQYVMVTKQFGDVSIRVRCKRYSFDVARELWPVSCQKLSE